MHVFTMLLLFFGLGFIALGIALKGFPVIWAGFVLLTTGYSLLVADTILFFFKNSRRKKGGKK